MQHVHMTVWRDNSWDRSTLPRWLTQGSTHIDKQLFSPAKQPVCHVHRTIYPQMPIVRLLRPLRSIVRKADIPNSGIRVRWKMKVLVSTDLLEVKAGITVDSIIAREPLRKVPNKQHKLSNNNLTQKLQYINQIYIQNNIQNLPYCFPSRKDHGLSTLLKEAVLCVRSNT